MTRLLILLVSLWLTACSNSSSNTELSLIESLIDTSWESSVCEMYNGYANTTHFFTVESSKLVYHYQYYGLDCVELWGEFTEERPYISGNEVITASGSTALEIDITKIVLPPDTSYTVKDLLYVNNGSLYFGITGREMDCEPGNLRVDVPALQIFVDAYLCDQRPTDMDYAHSYTKKI